MRKALFLMALLLLAGCLRGEGQTDRFETTADAITAESEAFLVQVHNHWDASIHAVSRNLELVGYSNGVNDDGNPNSIPSEAYYTELALKDGYVYMARTTVEPGISAPTPVCGKLPQPSASGVPIQHGGFAIINVQDPDTPLVVGSYEALGASDIELSQDSRFAFVSAQRNCPSQMLGVLQAEPDEPSNILPRGIHVVDISDRHNPTLAAFEPLPINGPHTLTYADVQGRELIFVSTYDLYDDPLSGALNVVSATQRLMVYELERDPALGTDSAALRLINSFVLPESAPAGQLYFPHDAVQQLHPFTNQELLYVAYWDKGLQIVDVTTLEGPLPAIGEFTEFSPSSRNNIHQVRPFEETIDGRHISVAEPEIESADETGYITFLDTSDPTRIAKVSHWKLPGSLFTQNFEFSPHNFALADGKVFLAHNHAGIWVIDVSDKANLESPKSAGYFLDVKQRTNSPVFQPYFWGTMLDDDGLVYAIDQGSGLYVLRYTGP